MTKSKLKPILLIDMDGVIADYYGRFIQEWKLLYPERAYIEAKDLRNFYIEEAYSAEYSKDITDITRSKGFFSSIQPVPGAIESLKKIIEDGHFEPYICTAPELDFEGQGCWTEKALWIESNLGKEWLKRLIICKDKTMVVGDYLLDDKPIITGMNDQFPPWNRIIFNHPYNEETIGTRLKDWSKWGALSNDLLYEFHNVDMDDFVNLLEDDYYYGH